MWKIKGYYKKKNKEVWYSSYPINTFNTLKDVENILNKCILNEIRRYYKLHGLRLSKIEILYISDKYKNEKLIKTINY
ncbi:hypothetical protein [Fusobacterium sp.]|uniref:hypothetical protein n=1 Tax=Fusobacterium sp. TaxID=68766 RepID=UPI002619FF4C|nr:hypothetical protein [Fusobacterium sp.]